MLDMLPRSYWEATACAAVDSAPLNDSVSADVCIVGGGYLGLSAALHLAQSGASVVLLEAHEPGWGASGRNGGQIIPYWKVEHAKMLRQYGPALADRAAHWALGFVNLVLGLIEAHNIACDAAISGWIQPAHSYAILRVQEQRAKEFQSQGADAYVVDATEARDLIGSGWYKGAFVDRRGARLHPLSYARGLARAASGLGARIYSSTPAIELHRRGTRWAVLTPTGAVTAATVLLCTNAYADEAGRRPLFKQMAGAVVPLNSYMIATQPLSEQLRRSILPNGETAADCKKLMHHFRLEPDGRLLFGGRGGLWTSNKASAYDPLLRGLSTLFPQLRDVPIDYRWSGKVAITVDGGPHFHRPAPGLIVAMGCNGRGVGMCTAAGKLLCELVNGLPDAESPMPIIPLKEIPLQGLRLVGAQAAVWYKAWQDRRDYRRAK